MKNPNPIDITSARSTVHALRMLSKGGISDSIVNCHKEGNNWDDDVWVPIWLSDRGQELKTYTRFNRMKSIPAYHRTHGRTSSVERDLIAYFSKYIPKAKIAEKFNVSLPTIHLYSKKTLVVV